MKYPRHVFTISTALLVKTDDLAEQVVPEDLYFTEDRPHEFGFETVRNCSFCGIATERVALKVGETVLGKDEHHHTRAEYDLGVPFGAEHTQQIEVIKRTAADLLDELTVRRRGTYGFLAIVEPVSGVSRPAESWDRRWRAEEIAVLDILGHYVDGEPLVQGKLFDERQVGAMRPYHGSLGAVPPGQQIPDDAKDLHLTFEKTEDGTYHFATEQTEVTPTTRSIFSRFRGK